MLNSSKTFTFPVIDAPGVDPKLLMIPNLLSQDALVTAINEAIPNPPPSADEFIVPDLVPDDGSSQRFVPSYRCFRPNVLGTNLYTCSSNSPPCSPQTYAYPSSQYVNISCGSPYSPTTSAQSPNPSAARVLIDAPCAGGKPVKLKGSGYICPVCNKVFRRRDDAMRHMGSAGMQVLCRYCGKPASGRRDGQRRHLDKNKNCLKVWETGRKAGLFIERTVEDAYN